MSSVLIRKSRVVTPYGVFKTDIYVSDGKVDALGEGLKERGAEVIDAEGMYVFPGFVDEHVHFREPGMEFKEDFETGTLAAAAGGVTTVLEMPNTVPPVADVKELRRKASLLKDKAYVDFGLYGVLTDESLDNIEEMLEAGAIGFKAFLGPTTGDISPPSDGTVLEALQKSRMKGFTLAFHCENRQLVHYFEQRAWKQKLSPLTHLESRPAICEVDSVRKITYYAEKTGGKALLLHLSSGETVDYLSSSHLENVIAETCPHYLFFDSRDYEKLGPLIKVNPPIRTDVDRKKLWNALRQGIVSNIGSDHAPHTLQEKERGMPEAPSGMVGVETVGPLMVNAALNGYVSLERACEALSANPAKTFNIYPRKGAIMPGSDADFVIIDPREKSRIAASKLHSKQKFTPFDGYELSMKIRYTILRGEVIAADGEPTGKKIGKQIP
ncbi:MAG: allantoinase AllB [Candidatus Caldarchaeum sp.]